MSKKPSSSKKAAAPKKVAKKAAPKKVAKVIVAVQTGPSAAERRAKAIALRIAMRTPIEKKIIDGDGNEKMVMLMPNPAERRALRKAAA